MNASPPILIACCLLLGSVDLAPTEAKEPFQELIQPAFTSHCIQCHGKDDKVKGKVDLLAIQSAAQLQADPELLETLIDVIDLQEMPPEDETQLTKPQRLALLDALEELLAKADTRLPQAPIRRMNRFQYNNAVIDLFALKRVVFALPERMMRESKPYYKPETGTLPPTVTVGSRPLGKSQLIEPRLAGVGPFPQDLRAEHGFDNRGDHLTLSPMLLEAFLKLSQSVVDSNDFNPKTVGIWSSFFAPPPASETRPREAVLRARISNFLRRAFRRTPPKEIVDGYVGYALARMEQDQLPWTDTLKEVASAAIASPRFLYLYDTGLEDSEPTQAADPFDLASRLSFFLWGSIPDEVLLDHAADGSLTQPDVLAAQVDRMILDRRSKRFCDSFPAQWLQLERIISSTPDRGHHPHFYFSKYRMSMHMMLEPLLVFERVFVENRSILEFVDSDYTYRSDPLTRFYDPNHKKAVGGNPTAIPFKRIALEDRRHGGLITTAATMTMTSNPEHSNPITRGAWLATVFFNQPPAPPPADVPPLSEKPPKGEEHLTLRERLATHRERADCAGCHEQIDPLGFALENYGPTGKWRDQYENGRDIDMQGELFRTHSFTNVVEFKDAILVEKDRYTRAFAEHLLSFALARSLSPADTPSVEAITKAAIKDEYRLHSLLRGVALSQSFRTKAQR